MSFDTPAGTYGVRMPSGRLAGRLFRQMNSLLARRIRRTGRFRGGTALILTTVGKKSGLERSTPVAWFAGDDDSWIIVASAGGAQAHPAWYHNLAAAPDKVRIEVSGRTVAVVAEELHGADRDRYWQKIIEAAPGFAGYQRKTDRELPVIRLVPRPE